MALASSIKHTRRPSPFAAAAFNRMQSAGAYKLPPPFAAPAKAVFLRHFSAGLTKEMDKVVQCLNDTETKRIYSIIRESSTSDEKLIYTMESERKKMRDLKDRMLSRHAKLLSDLKILEKDFSTLPFLVEDLERHIKSVKDAESAYRDSETDLLKFGIANGLTLIISSLVGYIAEKLSLKH